MAEIEIPLLCFLQFVKPQMRSRPRVLIAQAWSWER